MMIDLVNAFEWGKAKLDGKKPRTEPLLDMLIDTWQKHFTENHVEMDGDIKIWTDFNICHLGNDRGYICRDGYSFTHQEIGQSTSMSINCENDGILFSTENGEIGGLSPIDVVYATITWLGERSICATLENEEKLKAFVIDLQTKMDAQPRVAAQPAPAPAAQ